MGLTFSIDNLALSIVLDADERRPIGTAFSLIRPNWMVTAKHVVLVDGLARSHLRVSPSQGESVRAQVLFTHPDIDLAVLSLESDLCPRPLFPAHNSLVGSDGLVCAGFAPSRSAPEGGVMYANNIPKFEVEFRERGAFKEEIIVFDAPFSEGGHSGGPIFGAGGGVVGVMIQNFYDGPVLRARATGLAPILVHLTFA